MPLGFVDLLPLSALFTIIVLTLLLVAETGFHLGLWHQRRTETEVKGLNAAYLAAMLGLLAFMLAFTFGMASTHQMARRAVVLEEANAIGTAYLRAQLLPEPQGAELKDLLREYVDVRVAAATANSLEVLAYGIARSEELHGQLWAGSIALAKENPGSIFAGLFVAALNDVIDLHAKRVTVGLRHRIPQGINLALVFVAVVSMTMMGYQAGLTGGRTLIPRLALILAFGSIMLLIAEIDRPNKSIGFTSQEAMTDLQKSMRRAEGGPGTASGKDAAK